MISPATLLLSTSVASHSSSSCNSTGHFVQAPKFSGMKYYIIAGEASGDLHGSNLIKELKQLDASATFRCWGGDKMQQAGGELVKHYRELAFMGFTEVLMNLRTIFRNLAFLQRRYSAT